VIDLFYVIWRIIVAIRDGGDGDGGGGDGGD